MEKYSKKNRELYFRINHQHRIISIIINIIVIRVMITMRMMTTIIMLLIILLMISPRITKRFHFILGGPTDTIYICSLFLPLTLLLSLLSNYTYTTMSLTFWKEYSTIVSVFVIVVVVAFLVSKDFISTQSNCVASGGTQGQRRTEDRVEEIKQTLSETCQSICGCLTTQLWL